MRFFAGRLALVRVISKTFLPLLVCTPLFYHAGRPNAIGARPSKNIFLHISAPCAHIFALFSGHALNFDRLYAFCVKIYACHLRTMAVRIRYAYQLSVMRTERMRPRIFEETAVCQAAPAPHWRTQKARRGQICSRRAFPVFRFFMRAFAATSLWFSLCARWPRRQSRKTADAGGSGGT